MNRYYVIHCQLCKVFKHLNTSVFFTNNIDIYCGSVYVLKDYVLSSLPYCKETPQAASERQQRFTRIPTDLERKATVRDR